MRNTSLNLLQNYLQHRKQKTLANSILSNSSNIVCRVPQGSILGPLLFLIYVNDMPNVGTNCRIQMYADDTVVYACNDSYARSVSDLQSDLTRIQHWRSKNRLTVNLKKTKSMVVTTKHRLKKLAVQDLAMNNQTLEMVTSYKYLGLTLESCMGFEHHMKNLFKIIGHKVWLLSKLRRYVNLKSAEIIFKTMILPYFDYADIFYEATTVQNLSKLQRLQNRALRIVTQSKATDISTKDLQLSMNVTPLRLRREHHLMNFMYKRAEIPKYVDNRNLLTRAHDKKILKVLRPNLELSKNSIKFKGSVLWNSLDAGLQSTSSYKSFKAKSKLKVLNEFKQQATSVAM